MFMVEEVLKEVDLNLPIMGMVKNDKHQTKGLLMMSIILSLRRRWNYFRSLLLFRKSAQVFN